MEQPNQRGSARTPAAGRKARRSLREVPRSCLLGRRCLLLCLLFLLSGPAVVVRAASGGRTPAFPADRAWTHLEAQCRFGPRVPGTPAHQSCLSYLQSALEGTGGEVLTHRFRAAPGDGKPELVLTNVLARFGSGGAPLLLVAHWDSRPRADQDPDPANRARPIPGANDGASGTAVLLALAETFRDDPPPLPVEILLVDGEDQGEEGDEAGYLLGSREHASRLVPPYPRAVLVLDMVGGKDMRICREAYSEQYAKSLNDLIFARAMALRLPAFEDEVCHAVFDDHIPFLQRGIPAVDLIDFDYRQWHTLGDLPGACTKDSLDQLGRLLVDLLYGGQLQ
ncbi:MAG: M28 family peptidase [Candidatus Eisenbacteria bacterium]